MCIIFETLSSYSVATKLCLNVRLYTGHYTQAAIHGGMLFALRNLSFTCCYVLRLLLFFRCFLFLVSFFQRLGALLTLSATFSFYALPLLQPFAQSFDFLVGFCACFFGLFESLCLQENGAPRFNPLRVRELIAEKGVRLKV